MSALPSLPDDDPHGILKFWFEEVSPEEQFSAPPELDALCRERYLDLWEQARRGGCDGWRSAASPCLALIVLLDQLPRNMFRGDPRSFASDARALAVAKGAIERGFDMATGFPRRRFFYMPLMHSESLADQEQCVGRILMSGDGPDGLMHARAHRLVIRRFGRFPYRNAALGRATTQAEQAFLDAGGYRAAMAEVAG